MSQHGSYRDRGRSQEYDRDRRDGYDRDRDRYRGRDGDRRSGGVGRGGYSSHLTDDEREAKLLERAKRRAELYRESDDGRGYSTVWGASPEPSGE